MAKNELDLQMEDYQYLPLRDVVFRTLRQAILRGELKPGERLMEIRLANQLGVSRTPIREAIRHRAALNKCWRQQRRMICRSLHRQMWHSMM